MEDRNSWVDALRSAALTSPQLNQKEYVLFFMDKPKTENSMRNEDVPHSTMVEGENITHDEVPVVSTHTHAEEEQQEVDVVG